ncbi:WXG100-like domain-containing protein, partial [Amycolatopsis sp. H20-H5]|uniref:WXG100-like domain-containing protein n=1 Tax=Amycolatopsis sp. H20-H5 TaxID=3046309 RepID=UPI002DBDAC78
ARPDPAGSRCEQGDGMALNEPASPGGLWQAVLAIKPKDQVWPSDSEDTAYALADRWQAAAKQMTAGGAEITATGNRALAAWPDQAGTTLQARTDALGRGTYPELAAGMGGLGDRAAGYGETIQRTKTAITSEIAGNDQLYALARLVPGIGGALSDTIATTIAARAAALLGQAAGLVTQAGAAAGAAPIDLNSVLDLPLPGGQGELNGGVNPNLPTDLPTLQRLLDQARAAGLDPQRYKALLQQYWLAKAAGAAGIDLNAWDPQAGVDGNMKNLTDVYKYYGKLFLDHPELQWAGMANMIGPSFAAGFMDLNGMQDLARKLATSPLPLPADLATRLAAFGGSQELGWFENKFLAMQKNIFIDQASMHEAYLGGGLGALDEIRRAGLVDAKAMGAWADIASGDQARIQRGNTALLDREQNQVIADQYDQMYHHDGPVGAGMTYMMTVAGDASIPGAKTPAGYHAVDVGIPGGLGVRTPLPDFNVSDRQARWDYVTNDTLPAYQRLLHDDPDLARRLVASPVEDRIASQRLDSRWPKLVRDLTTLQPVIVPLPVPH